MQPLNMHGHAATWEEELLETARERDEARAEVERLRTVVEAARTLRAIAGTANKHAAACQDSPCDVCDGLAEVEGDATNELDMRLLELARTTEVSGG